MVEGSLRLRVTEEPLARWLDGALRERLKLERKTT